MEWILKAWRGEEKLWKVFWIYGIIFGIILAVINSVIASFLGTVVVIPYLVIRTIYSIFLDCPMAMCI